MKRVDWDQFRANSEAIAFLKDLHLSSVNDAGTTVFTTRLASVMRSDS